MKVAGIQFASSESKEENLRKAEDMVDRAVASGRPDLVCFQELFTTRYFPSTFNYAFFKLAEKIPGPTTERMSRLAQRHGIYIVAPIYEEAGPNVYFNSAPLIAPDGKIVGVTRKIHIPLFDYRLKDENDGLDRHICSYEKFYYTGATDVPVFDTPIGKIGILICWDNEFFELWRMLEMKGVELICSPYAMSRPAGEFYSEQWLFEARCSAYYFSSYVMKVNRVGAEGDMVYRGRSVVVDPLGKIVAGPIGEDEGIVSAELDLAKVRELRVRRPRLMNRRPDVYRPLAEPLPHSEAIFNGQPTQMGKTI